MNPATVLRTLQPIDPDRPAGKAAALALGELFDDIAARLRREGQPVPDCISPPADDEAVSA